MASKWISINIRTDGSKNDLNSRLDAYCKRTRKVKGDIATDSIKAFLDKEEGVTNA